MATNSQVNQVLAVARSQVGYREGYAEGGWNNQVKYATEVPGLLGYQGQSWCMTFTSWVAMRAGVASLFPRGVDCSAGVTWFTNASRWSWFPAIGAQVFYGSGGQDHTGIVYAYDATSIWAIEGNTSDTGSNEGDGVYLRRRRRADAVVYGYGLPAYAEGVITSEAAKRGVPGFNYQVSWLGGTPVAVQPGGFAVNNLFSDTLTVAGAANVGRLFLQQNDAATVGLEVIAASSAAPQTVLVKDADGNVRFEITAPGVSIHRALAAFTSNLQIGAAAADVGGGAGVIGIKNAATVPSANSTGGGSLYAEGGALKWRGSGGTVTTLGPA